MAITTLDGAIAGMQYPREIIKGVSGTMVAGRPFSYFYIAGQPGAAVPCTAGIAGEALTTYAGQIPFDNPVSGNTYLARFAAQITIAGTLVLADRVWHNNGLDITSGGLQTVNSVAFPARDDLGTINGHGYIVGVEITTTTGAGTPTLTMTYTNSVDVDTRTASNVIATNASSIAGTFYPLGLQAGDYGVKSIQSFQLSSTWTSGAFSLVVYRILARLPITAANTPAAIDALTGGFVRLYDNSVPFIIFKPSTTTTSTLSAHVIWTQG